MPQSLEEKIAEVNNRGWTIHSLYQGDSQWEARIKLKDSGTVYGNGEGATPSEALGAALQAGITRLEWRPVIASVPPSGAPHGKPRSPATTDDLMKGLDL